MSGSGYEEVGEVVDVGEAVSGVRAGEMVWGAWGHRSDGVIPGALAAASSRAS